MTRRALQRADDGGADDAPSGVLLWRRIADELEQSIARGTYEPGSKLPGEIDIAERFGVNRHTVRRAIAALAQRGIVRAERGSGTYIEQRRIPYPIRSRTRFSEIVGGAGHAVGGRLIAHAVEEADPHLAKQLKLKPGTPVLRLERLRHADRVPICIGSTWLEAGRFPGASRVYAASNSITRMLAHFGVRNYARKSSHVTAAIAEAADAATLRIATGRPLLVVDSIDVDADGKPILFTHARFAADRLELVIEP
ncbi:MAG TPA: phosphonate metabolism transcriptional regulator PhnF [Xanthobacteraceae bacterium]|jgi:GntR family phosphonate transport system transcriptional regulator